MLIVAVLAAVALSGCGGKAKHDGVASVGNANASPTPSLSDQDKELKFSECMRQHGIDVSDPGANAGGTSGPVAVQPSNETAMRQAMDACKQYAPSGILKTPGASDMDAMRAYAKCMREHGVNMPDPDPAGGAVIQSAGTDSGPNVDPNSQTFKDANTACEHLMPGNMTIHNGGSK
jgi:hypothetical protein